jgi:hypothetical protein
MTKEYRIRMTSDEYGEEVFNYSTLREARAGWKRLVKSCTDQQDGVGRHLELVDVLEQQEIPADAFDDCEHEWKELPGGKATHFEEHCEKCGGTRSMVAQES